MLGSCTNSSASNRRLVHYLSILGMPRISFSRILVLIFIREYFLSDCMILKFKCFQSSSLPKGIFSPVALCRFGSNFSASGVYRGQKLSFPHTGCCLVAVHWLLAGSQRSKSKHTDNVELVFSIFLILLFWFNTTLIFMNV